MTAPLHATNIVTVIQGEYKVSADPDTVFSTLLGSCVSVCLSDIENGMGGMNHFLLPDRSGPKKTTVKYGANAMEVMINALLKMGARRSNFVAKVFGGSKMNDALSDIGMSNITFARQFLSDEKIPCLSESLGGNQARRIRFRPSDAQAQVMLVARSDTPKAERLRTPKPPHLAPDITLF